MRLISLGPFTIALCLLASQAHAGRAYNLVSRLPETDLLRALQSIIVNADACTDASKMISWGIQPCPTPAIGQSAAPKATTCLRL